MDYSKLHVSPSPHLRDTSVSTFKIMFTVILALMPTTIFGIFHFGWYCLLLILVTVGTAVLSEFVYEKIVHKPVTIKDGSAILTGLLLALNFPPTLGLPYAMLGAVFAIIVVKMLYGGLGRNFMNPALAGRVFLLISFAGPMTNFVNDGISGATPLAEIKNGGRGDLLAIFLGNTSGTIGETCTWAVILGGLFLVILKIIDWKIPFSYLLTFSVFVLLFGGHGFDLYYLGCQLCCGGVLLGAFFMATDYATSPVTPFGRIVFGFILGVLTGLFRIFGDSAEGVSYAIIFTNLLVPLIERFTMPRVFGRGGETR